MQIRCNTDSVTQSEYRLYMCGFLYLARELTVSSINIVATGLFPKLSQSNSLELIKL